MKSINQMNIQDYIEIAARRKWLIIVPVIIVMVSGALLSHAVPPVYEARIVKSSWFCLNKALVILCFLYKELASPCRSRVLCG